MIDAVIKAMYQVMKVSAWMLVAALGLLVMAFANRSVAAAYACAVLFAPAVVLACVAALVTKATEGFDR